VILLLMLHRRAIVGRSFGDFKLKNSVLNRLEVNLLNRCRCPKVEAKSVEFADFPRVGGGWPNKTSKAAFHDQNIVTHRI
jgi:hypothetical protein